MFRRFYPASPDPLLTCPCTHMSMSALGCRHDDGVKWALVTLSRVVWRLVAPTNAAPQHSSAPGKIAPTQRASGRTAVCRADSGRSPSSDVHRPRRIRCARPGCLAWTGCRDLPQWCVWRDDRLVRGVTPARPCRAGGGATREGQRMCRPDHPDLCTPGYSICASVHGALCTPDGRDPAVDCSALRCIGRHHFSPSGLSLAVCRWIIVAGIVTGGHYRSNAARSAAMSGRSVRSRHIPRASWSN